MLFRVIHGLLTNKLRAPVTLTGFGGAPRVLLLFTQQGGVPWTD
jgi:hypothetical protein